MHDMDSDIAILVGIVLGAAIYAGFASTQIGDLKYQYEELKSKYEELQEDYWHNIESAYGDGYEDGYSDGVFMATK